MQLLIYHEEKRIGHHRHLLLVVLHIVVLRLLEYHLDTRFGEVFDERGVFRQTLVGAQQQLTAFSLVAFGNLLLCFLEGRGHKGPLGKVKLLHIRTEFHKLGLVRLVPGHRTGNDQRRTGVIDQHGVNLIDDGVVVLALHEVLLADGHIVAQIVEAEFVVGTEGNVAVVGAPSGI